MAGNKCVYFMCGKNSRNHPVSLFGFPKDLERSRKWITHSGLFFIGKIFKYM